MQTLVPLISLLVFVGVLYVAYKIVLFSHRSLWQYFGNAALRISVHLGLILLACAIGIWLTSVSYNYSETEIFVGVPVPWAVWEFRDGAWRDFVGLVSIFAWVADIAIAINLVHLRIAAAFFIKSRNSRFQ